MANLESPFGKLLSKGNGSGFYGQLPPFNMHVFSQKNDILVSIETSRWVSIEKLSIINYSNKLMVSIETIEF